MIHFLHCQHFPVLHGVLLLKASLDELREAAAACKSDLLLGCQPGNKVDAVQLYLVSEVVLNIATSLDLCINWNRKLVEPPILNNPLVTLNIVR